MEVGEYTIPEADSRYQKSVNLVKGFAKCIIDNDLSVMVSCWLHFRLEKYSTHVERLKDLFQMMFRKEMILEISCGSMILFKDAPLNTHVPICELSNETKQYLQAMVIHRERFFDKMESMGGVGIEYMSFSKFKFNATFRDSELWVSMAKYFIELMLMDDVNRKYLNNRGMEILMCILVDEIAHSYEDYTEKARSNGGNDWRLKNKDYLNNLKLLYNDFSKRLRPYGP